MIDINGVQYELIPAKPKKDLKLSPIIQAAMMMGGMYLPYTMGRPVSSRQAREIDPYDLVAEYKLILEKKSKLSRSERESVIAQFNRNFRKVENPPQD